MVVFGQKWLYSGKGSCVRVKRVYSCKSGYIWAKVVVIGQNSCIRAKVVVFGKVVVLGKNGCIRAKMVICGQRGYIPDKVIVFR